MSLTREDLEFLHLECPSATDFELHALDKVLGLTPTKLYLDGYTLSDLIDALRIGMNCRRIGDAPTNTPKDQDSNATRS